MYVADLTRIILLLMAGFLIVLYRLPYEPIKRRREPIAVYLFCLTLTALLTVLFHGTPFGLNSYMGDQHYLLAAITKYRYGWAWSDFSYAHLPAYYPPLYFYVLGKVAWLAHIAPYHMVKLGFLAAALFLPAITYHVWSRLIGKRPALCLTFLLFLGFPSEFLYKTYEFSTAVLIVPWWLYFGERAIPAMWATRRAKTFSLIAGGITGAIIFQTYYYWFFLIVCAIIVSSILHWMQRSSAGSHAAVESPFGNGLWHKLRMLMLVFILSAYYWVPLLVDAVTVGYQNFQNRWLSLSMMSIHFFDQLNTMDILTAAELAGFLYLLVHYTRSKTSRVLFELTLACFVWYLVGFVGILFGSPNLHMKAWLLNDSLLLVGAVLAIERLLQMKRVIPYANRLWLFAACVVILAQGQVYVETITGQSQPTGTSKYYETALTHTKPPGSVKELAAVGNVNGKVFLTDQTDDIDFAPFDLFIDENPNYANPSARYGDRAQFVSTLGQVHSAQAFAWLLQYNEFDTVDYIWMTHPYLVVGMDNYPNGTRYKRVSIPTVYKHSPDFSRVGSTDIYKVLPVSKTAYQHFDLYALAVASRYAQPSLQPDVLRVFQQRVRTVHNEAALQSITPVLQGDPSLAAWVAARAAALDTSHGR
ncbi:arabinofuranosyltransferase [Alicyclobacillus cycloheptanicus]|uniref:Arabinofuranosyltransferase AftA n=1 Tax=Alicyclobacillus cycloheptanicus TaxID=1457 RepID=A0ABT9XEF1_9BACL|nr:arabinofuranosyltransferase [Alicyclobacillus cycloheptanicus]MDQ0188510.1 hypothetical protein [Alicyclobacillus cycloheptanicus]WDM01197.1 arabinofuranosyltransferase [Alicyclobacillus cycloheptanicus]